MLVEIMCDKFISIGIQNNRINFKEGLNTVLGTEKGKNSIGKSTLLMIVDFVFGGSDYVEKLSDVEEYVKEHTIYFTFKFDNKLYSFGRQYENPNVVLLCNSDYSSIEDKTWKIDDYTKWLKNQYAIKIDDLSFRQAVSRFIRVDKRDTLDETKPLQEAKKQSEKDQIYGLIKICNRYDKIGKQEKVYKTADDKYKIFKGAKDYDYINIVKKDKDYDANIIKISELESKINELIHKNNNNTVQLEPMQKRQLGELREKLTKLEFAKSLLINQLNSIHNEICNSDYKFKTNFDDLKYFFPNVNADKIVEIETFHKKLKKVFNDELEIKEEELQNLISSTDEKIEKLDKEISNISNITNVAEATLKEYAHLNAEKEILEKSNKNYEKLKNLKEDAEKQKEKLENLVEEESKRIEEMYNEEMQKINNEIFDDNRVPPKLNIISASKYEFYTRNDTGTGARERSLVVFDLATLTLTDTPIIVHDSPVLKQIEDDVIEKILKLYIKSKRQIFIAFDKHKSYSKYVEEILEKTTVVKLSKNNGALFGREWSKENDGEQ